jgi:predicted unusual protein kinase regulating ubiquinone biosynthesis (AarF/ABC1/UbiB family)
VLLCFPLFCAGEKLSESRASDIRELCNTLLSAYLIQLLDTGLLHADPHPGNLIRTGVQLSLSTAGRACWKVLLLPLLCILPGAAWCTTCTDSIACPFAPGSLTLNLLCACVYLVCHAEDGKICVLDFGLMTEVTPTQRIALFEYIAHLTTQVCYQHSCHCASVVYT